MRRSPFPATVAWLALSLAGCEAGDAAEVALFVAVMALVIWFLRRVLLAERRGRERREWLLRNGQRTNARIASMSVTASSPHGREPHQIVRFSFEFEHGGATVSATVLVPLAKMGSVRTGGALPVCFDPQKPTDLAVDWALVE